MEGSAGTTGRELRWNYQLLALICLDFQFALLARFPRPLFVSYILTFL